MTTKLHPTTTEIVPPSWDRARDLIATLKLHLRLSLAVQIALGHELLHLKKDLGFVNGRNQHTRVGHDVQPSKTWQQWVQEELGVSYKTADRWIDCHEAAKARLKKLGGEGKLLTLIDMPPATLGAEDRTALETMVAKLVDGESQKDLLAEFRLITQHVALTGGDTSAHAKKPEPATPQQLSFVFFAPICEALHKARSLPTYDEFLHALPLSSDDAEAITLERLEREHRIALDDVRAAIKAAKGKTLP